jgi:hypothetical protein
MSKLLKELRSPGISAEEVFTRTRIGVSRASEAEQVPWVASSLLDLVYLVRATADRRALSPGAGFKPSRTYREKTQGGQRCAPPISLECSIK